VALRAELREAVQAAVASVTPSMPGGRGGAEDVVSHADVFDRSPKMRGVEALVVRIADLATPVLVRGEPGVGKERVARAIHHLSRRAQRSFVKVTCAALAAQLIEAEIFGDPGHTAGKLESAVGGTFFIDELSDVPAAVQSRLVRVLADRTLDVRIMAATSMDPYSLVSAGRLRSDLYEELAVASVTVPPLRDRAEEIEPLARSFLHRFHVQFQKPMPTLSSTTADALRRYEWPGNVRELENMIKRWVVLGAEADLLEELRTRATSPRQSGIRGTEGLSLREIGRRAAREAERFALQDVLTRTKGNRSAAARELRVSYKTLLQKLTATGIALTAPAGRSPRNAR
jgi:transcriptional regulator with PAS, ATPase and Fis domain